MSKISKVHGRQILDSRGDPTVEVDILLEDGSMGRAAVPSGASTGIHEALELRDGDEQHFNGQGVMKAVAHVNGQISAEVTGKEFTQKQLDDLMLQVDGTENKSHLGANAMLGVSLAFAKAMSGSQHIPFYAYVGKLFKNDNFVLPRPMFNIMNGGRHANWATDVQEFMIIVEHKPFSEQLRAASEIFHALGEILQEAGMSTNVGNEGGFAPGFHTNTEAFDFISRAVEKASYKLGEDVMLGVDIAASEFYNPEKNVYELKTEKRELSIPEWHETLREWMKRYPLISIEDPFAQDDWGNWSAFTAEHGSKLQVVEGSKLQVVGDDLLVTNTKRVKRAIEEKACNALLVKVNQIGTLSETLDAMQTSAAAGWNNIVSHRSGETEDTSISHIAVGTGCGQIKTGAPSRGERIAKYNELLRISELLQ